MTTGSRMQARPFSILCISALLILGGCSSKTAVRYDSVGDIAQALVQEDVPCTPSESGSGEAELVKEQGVCEIDGADLEIFLFDDVEQRDSWLEFGGRLRPATATGPNWAIIGDEEVVSTAADALGAERRE